MEIIKENHWLKGGRRINKANVVFHPCSEETGLSDIPPSSGKTYYQRMQVAKLQEVASSKPLTAKKYIKGVDFSYSIYR